MRGDSLPDSDHVARYCKKASLGTDGEITGAAFMLRRDEDHLSVNWLELFAKTTRQEEITELREIYQKKFRNSANSKIVLFEVGEIREYVFKESPDKRSLKILHEPSHQDPSHSGIFGLTLQDELIAALIAEVVQETYPT